MKQLGLNLHKPDKAYQGYTLISPMEGTNTYLIDMRGRIVHRWRLPYRPGDYGYLLNNGNLLVAGRTNKGPVTIGGRSGIILEFNWDGERVWGKANMIESCVTEILWRGAGYAPCYPEKTAAGTT